MRIFTPLIALLMLSACATAAPTNTPLSTNTPASGGSNRIAGLLAQAGRNDAPTREAIERAIGEADIARQDGVGVALTYRLQNCALLLLFASDGRNVMRLREAHAGPRRSGEAAPTLDQCAAEAGARS